MKHKQFRESVFCATVEVYCDCPLTEVDKHLGLPPTEGPRSRDSAQSFRISSEKNVTRYVLWVKDSKDYHALVHEAVHTVEKIFEDRGVEFKGEQAAYYIEYWVTAIWHWMATVKKRSP